MHKFLRVTSDASTQPNTNTPPPDQTMNYVALAAVVLVNLVFIILFIIALADANSEEVRQVCLGRAMAPPTEFELFNAVAVNLLICFLALILAIFGSLVYIENPKVQPGEEGKKTIHIVAFCALIAFIVLAVLCVNFNQKYGSDCKTLLKTKSHAVPLDIAAYLCTALDCVWAVATVVYLWYLDFKSQ